MTTPATSDTIQPTLFIGLGGTGKEVLLRLRRKFYERWRRPDLPCVAFLWLDTDTRDSKGAKGEELDKTTMLDVGFRVDERIELLHGTVAEDLGDVLKNKLRNAYIHQWLHPEVEKFGADIGDGAGSVRTIGRLTLFAKYGTVILPRLRYAIDKISTQSSKTETTELLPGVAVEGNPVAYVIFSVAGGTGGGTFLDVAFLLRDLQGAVKRTTGIVVLPNVYHDPFTEEGARSHGNAYSALMELEHFSRRVRPPRVPGDEIGVSIDFDVDWNNQGIRPVMGPPFNSLYVCERRNELRQSVDQHELFNVIANAMFLEFLPGPFATARRQRLSNIFQQITTVADDAIDIGGTRLTQTFSRRYSAFGMSRIEMPMESIKEACACRLASEMVGYWDRSPEEQNLKSRLARDAQGRFDAVGLEGLFGNQWKMAIDAMVGKTLPEALPPHTGDSPTPLEKFIDALPNRFQELQEKLLSRSGMDRLTWGQVPATIRAARGDVQTTLQRSLREWVAGALDAPELGLNALVDPAGLINEMKALLQRSYKARPNDATRRKEKAEAEAVVRKQRRDAAASEMKLAVRSPLIAALGLRSWTLDELYRSVRDEAVQHAKAAGAAYLAEEASEIARYGDEQLDDVRVRLQQFKDRLPLLVSVFEGLKRGFLSFMPTYQSIRLFDEKEDLPRFYLLDFDGAAGKHLPVNRVAEHRRFIEGQLGARKGTFDLIDEASGEREEWLQETVRLYAVKRFQDDFDACRLNRDAHRQCGRFIDVMEHGQFKRGTEDKIRQFVDGAMPMVLARSGLHGAERESKQAYLGLPAPKAAPYRNFAERVRQRLATYGYTLDEPFESADPTSIQLYVERNAFTLPSLDLVVGDCHTAYYDFYHGEKGAPKEKRYKIPLHLCRTWEGEFDDLKPLDESLGPQTRDALTVLTLGPLLGVVRLTENNGRREFGYRRWVPPSSVPNELGNKRQAREWLVREQSVRTELLEHIHTREERLKRDGDKREGLLAYFWALAYLDYKLFPVSSPEHSIIEERRIDFGHVLREKGISYPELTDQTPAEQILNCKRQLAGRAEWVGDFPVLSSFKPFVLGKGDELHASV